MGSIGSRPGTFLQALADGWFLAAGANKGRLSAAFQELIQQWSAPWSASSTTGCEHRCGWGASPPCRSSSDEQRLQAMGPDGPVAGRRGAVLVVDGWLLGHRR
ncbi:MAG: hypothetical protein ACKO8I_08830 [Cyanobacteriota bacterium]